MPKFNRIYLLFTSLESFSEEMTNSTRYSILLEIKTLQIDYSIM